MADGFKLERSKQIAALNLTFEEYVHTSGAKHYHLANDYAENVFMVAFRTVPYDSTGVAHILEHTALCGSDKFPVRDPFFMMIRRSLNTFMNAFTTSDYTAYPFASQNRKDYFNLLEVYLDAVFFSRLDTLDFSQEGHRIEFQDPEDSNSPLVYKGVVYNEMKGDTSSPVSMLYQATQEALYPTSTYHYNSGGDPASIPSLSYEQLRAFYQSHYHPSNAIFMTFGDLDAVTVQRKIALLALDRLEPSSAPPIAVVPEVRYKQPVVRELSYPVDEDDTSGKTHIVLAWLLGKNTDLKMLLRCHLLSDVLLDTSASPLRHALEKTDLATAASPMCGFEEDHMEMNFMCGVEGSEPEHADAIERLVLGVLENVAKHGVAEDRLEAVLHQLELSQREIGGDGWPYGLQLIFSCMSAAVHRGDPIGLLDLDAALQEMRQEIKDPGFIKRLVSELLLGNSHRVKVIMKPDRELASRLIEEEQSKLEALRTSFSDAERSNVLELAEALKKRQSQKEDLSLLPQVTRADIPPSKAFPVLGGERIKSRSLEAQAASGIRLTTAKAGTNGITFHQVVSPLPALTIPLLGLLPIYSQVVTEVGSAGRDYLETQQAQHSTTGGISAFSSFRSDLNDCDDGRGFLTLSSRTLNPKAVEMACLVKETANEPRFDEVDRIRELVQQLSIRRSNSIASNGHQYAMSAAAASLRPLANISDFLSGIPAIMRLKKLARDIDDDQQLQDLAAAMQQLHDRLRRNSPELLVISEAAFLERYSEAVSALWGETVQAEESRFDVASIDKPGDRAFVVTTQVNYCASVYPTIPESSEDAAALSVLAGVLRNNYLHAEVREKGGAYGGGAGHDSTTGLFRFYSYRDPRLMDTFEAFSESIDWALNNDITDLMLEEAVLGIISSVDAPGSPSGEIRQAFHHGLFGRSAEHREASRGRYLEVRQKDLRRVIDTYLHQTPSRAVVTSENLLGEVDNQFEQVFVNE
ncbi:insulinase family protein [Gammaproteobacteria bacterium]|nr:insulinase family protein [Gammaproteobacteria bacterium]